MRKTTAVWALVLAAGVGAVARAQQPGPAPVPGVTDRLGLDDNGYEILGVTLPYVEMPVGPGRNLAVLIEVAARNHLLKLKGFHPARELARKLGERMQPAAVDSGDDQIGTREPGDGEGR